MTKAWHHQEEAGSSIEEDGETVGGFLQRCNAVGGRAGRLSAVVTGRPRLSNVLKPDICWLLTKFLYLVQCLSQMHYIEVKFIKLRKNNGAREVLFILLRLYVSVTLTLPSLYFLIE